MAKTFLFLFLFTSLTALSQGKPPIALSNPYTLSDADGFTAFNYSAIYVGASGKVYTRSYDGDVAIHGNNYTIPVPSLSRLPVGNGNFLERSDNVACYYDAQRVAVLKGDSVYKTLLWPASCKYTVAIKNFVVGLNPKAAGHKTWLFDGTSIQAISNEPVLSTTAVINAQSQTAVYLTDNSAGLFTIYRLDTVAHSWQKCCQHSLVAQSLAAYTNCNNFIYFSTNRDYRQMVNGKPSLPLNIDIGAYPVSAIQPDLYPLLGNGKNKPYYDVMNIASSSSAPLATVYSGDLLNLIAVDKADGSYYMISGNKPMRVFTTLKKYPQVFNGSNSLSLFALVEDTAGGIWAGNYQGGVTYIKGGAIQEFPQIKSKILNGSAAHSRFVYMISENNSMGLMQIAATGKIKHLTDSVYGFYNYISKDQKRFYYGTGNDQGLWITSTKTLDEGQPVWMKIGPAQGLNLYNILTITEDSVHRVWCGHSKRGIAIYDPKTNAAKTWLVEKSETPFGGFSSLTDRWGTVWIGTGSKGLWYYSDYTKPPSPQSCLPVKHPFFQSANSVSAMTIYKQWLVLAATDKILLLNLDSFHLQNKIVLRYLNPMEAAFTSFTEQNTMLTSKKDSSIWFSTGDMLYNWNITQWLQLPQYKVSPQVIVSANGVSVSLSLEKETAFDAGFQSFDLVLRYLSPDGMPRFTSAALFKQADGVALPPPSRESLFAIKNTSSGHYQFVVEVYETDGSTSRYYYKISIAKFIWQQWWFWAILSAAALLIIAFVMDLKRRHQVAVQKAKTREAELYAVKTEGEKKLADLQLKILSSQFRPHFILNSLNTIGAQMDDKPEAETVLSRLGESVNLIFNHTLEQRVLHSFATEWQLTLNVIHIHRLIYLKSLQSQLPDEETIAQVKDVQLPLGLLQIHVENALLHGLNNRAEGPWQLAITIAVQDETITIAITDNGVGRKQSTQLSNFNKHGTGTKNLSEVIRIINASNEHKISVTYKDGIYKNLEGDYGTEVMIIIPKNLRYQHE